MKLHEGSQAYVELSEALDSICQPKYHLFHGQISVAALSSGPPGKYFLQNEGSLR
jgi:hypothetical protein